MKQDCVQYEKLTCEKVVKEQNFCEIGILKDRKAFSFQCVAKGR